MTTSTEGPGPTGQKTCIQLKLNKDLLGSYPGMPKKVIGMYILLADDTEDG